MRDRIKMLIFAAIGFLWIISWFVVPAKWTVPATLVLGLGLIALLIGGLYSTLLLKTRSPQMSAYGTHTSLQQRDPVDTCPFTEPARTEADNKDGCVVKIHGPKTYTLGLFPHGGCAALNLKGGGADGYTVGRLDLTRSPGNDGSTLDIFGKPLKFRAGGGAGFLDLNDLPEDVQGMLRRHPNWKESSPVNFITAPLRGFEIDDLNKNATLDYQMLWHEQIGISNSKSVQIGELSGGAASYGALLKSTIDAGMKKEPQSLKDQLFGSDEK